MGKREAVGSMSDWSGMLKDFWRQIDDGTMTLEKMEAIVGGKIIYPEISDKWMNDILSRNLQCLLGFGIVNFDQSQSFFRTTLERIGEKRVRSWQRMLLETGYWPTISLGPDDNFSGLRVKPESRYYIQAKEGSIFWLEKNGELVKIEKPYILQGGVYLMDSRCKPSYKDGRQMWRDDKRFLGWRIEKIRKEKKLARYDWCDLSSRFGISAVEAEQHLWPMLHAHADFQIAEDVRSERVSEFNFISQCFIFMPRSKDGQTNTSIWFADYFGDRGGRLRGGDSDGGGLADVDWGDAGGSWRNRSVHPLAVLALETL